MSNWDQSRVSLLTKWWAEGTSAGVIAAKLGGTTRNACIGKVHRMKLPSHKSPQQADRQAKRNRRRAKARANGQAAAHVAAVLRLPKFQIVPLPPPTGEVGTIPFAHADHRHCLWIPADPREDSRVCGKSRVRGTSWCEDHLRRASGSPPARRPALPEIPSLP